MGKILSVVTRPIRNFNIENRARKVISKEKPLPAPKHKANINDYEVALKDSKVLKDIQTKNEELDKYLRNVYVTSYDKPHEPLKQSNPERPLPIDRNVTEDFEYGYKEPDKVAHGHVTLKNALQFINDHQNNSQIHTIDKISDEYLLDTKTVANILKYYKVFEVYLPEQRQVKATFYGPKVKRHTIEIRKTKELNEGKLQERKVLSEGKLDKDNT